MVIQMKVLKFCKSKIKFYLKLSNPSKIQKISKIEIFGIFLIYLFEICPISSKFEYFLQNFVQNPIFPKLIFIKSVFLLT